MTRLLKLISGLTNDIHDILMEIFSLLGFNFTDKQLHYIIVGIIGMLVFLAVNFTFKHLAKYSVSAISFIYTFTVLVVFVFAIEIEQKLTGRGNMEFKDITAGLWGFIELFGVYLLIKLVVFLVRKLYKVLTEKKVS